MSEKSLRGPRILTRLFEIGAVRESVVPGLHQNYHPDRRLSLCPGPSPLPEGTRTPEAYLNLAEYVAKNAFGGDYAAQVLRNGRLRRSVQRKIMTVALENSIKWGLSAKAYYEGEGDMGRVKSMSQSVEADRGVLEKAAHPEPLARFLDKIF